MSNSHQLPWSAWAWSDQYHCFERYAVSDTVGDYVWDYSPQPTEDNSASRNVASYDHQNSQAAWPSTLELVDDSSPALNLHQASSDLVEDFGNIKITNQTLESTSLPITLYGESNFELPTTAILDGSSSENYISLQTVDALGLRHNSKQKTRSQNATRKLESAGEIVLHWCIATAAGFVTKSATFRITNHLSVNVSVVFGDPYIYQENLRGLQQSDPLDRQPQERYSKVRVHTVRWLDEGELECASEVDKLEDTFWTQFQLNVTQFLIPSGEDAQEEFEADITKELAECGATDLFILYYAGHGTIEQTDFALVQDGWTGKKDECVFWEPIQTLLKNTKSDVLLLLDTCYSEAATRSVTPATKIAIAACPADKETAGPGDRSYTAALISALETMNRTTFSALKIRDGILAHRIALRKSLAKSTSNPKKLASKLSAIHNPVLRKFSGKGDITLVVS